jgi:glycosyltransferase involved in cell wall biosynthesis
MVQLSVIVPVYNKAAYLEQTIQSILNQTVTAFELILINDGSTDESLSILNKWSAIDKRIFIINQLNTGVSAARNRGIDHASGDFIGFIDGDDTIEPDMFELLLKNAVQYDADISVCRLKVNMNGRLFAPVEDREIKLLNHTEALRLCLLGDLDRSANNKIYKAEILKNIRFEGQMYEDILFTCKAFIAANKTVFQNVVKYNYMVRGNSVSMSSFGTKYFETINVSKKMVDLVSKTDGELAVYAEVFDVVANISLLNLLLLSDKKKYTEGYELVVKNLSAYSDFILKSPYIEKKHKYAFQVYSVSPKLYTLLMYTYCKITGSELISRI